MRTGFAPGRPAWDVTPEGIDRVVGDLLLVGRAASTRREYVQVYVDDFNASRHVGDDSLAGLPPRTPERVAEFSDFFKAWIATTRKHAPVARDYAMFRPLYYAGLRSEEASLLEYPDAHFSRGPFGKLKVRFGGDHHAGRTHRRGGQPRMKIRSEFVGVEGDFLALDEELDPGVGNTFGQRIGKVQQDSGAVQVQQGGAVLCEAQPALQHNAVPVGPDPRTGTSSRLGVPPSDDVLVDGPLDVVLARLCCPVPAPADCGVTKRGSDIGQRGGSGKPRDLHQFDQHGSIMQYPRRNRNL